MGYSIKQQKTGEYLVCYPDSKLTGEAMAPKVLKNKSKLKFLYWQSRYLTSAYKTIMELLIKLHFDYKCSLWFHLLRKNQSQTSKSSKQMYLFLPKFRKIDWLFASDRVE